MKIAHPTEDGTTIFGHFGKTPAFKVYTVEDGKIVDEQLVKSPGHVCGAIGQYMALWGVEVVIAGGMGGGPLSSLAENKVDVYLGVTGDGRTAVESYLNGTLESGNAVCNCDHDHPHA